MELQYSNIVATIVIYENKAFNSFLGRLAALLSATQLDMNNEFLMFDLQLLGWFPFMCDHCSGRLSGGSHRSVGEAEKRVQKSGLPRQLVWTVCWWKRGEPVSGSVRLNADPDCTVYARDVASVLTHGEGRKQHNTTHNKKWEKTRGKTREPINTKNKTKKNNEGQNSSSHKWIYIFHLEKRRFLQETMASRGLLGMLKHICLTLGRFHEIFIRYWVEMTAWIYERSWLE